MDSHKLINIISSKGKSIEGASDYEFWNEDQEGVVAFDCTLEEAAEKAMLLKNRSGEIKED